MILCHECGLPNSLQIMQSMIDKRAPANRHIKSKDVYNTDTFGSVINGLMPDHVRHIDPGCLKKSEASFCTGSGMRKVRFQIIAVKGCRTSNYYLLFPINSLTKK